MAQQSLSLIPHERIENRIFLIRGKKVMFDSDLAALYGVQTKVLNQAVKRNKKRFPDEDFMFQLTEKEAENFKRVMLQSAISKKEEAGLRSQIVTLKTGSGKHRKYLPFAFTESGVAMLSSVLNSERAIQVNIKIIKTFTRLRELVASNKELREKLEEMERGVEKRLGVHDAQLKAIFEAIQKLLTPPEEPKKNKIGFRVE
jgi:phage regulator Rha-like protein